MVPCLHPVLGEDNMQDPCELIPPWSRSTLDHSVNPLTTLSSRTEPHESEHPLFSYRVMCTQKHLHW